MRICTLGFSFLLILLNLGFNHGIKKSDTGNCGGGPDPAYCGCPSSIADLFCFLSGSPQPGQSYVYIGFDDYIVAFCSYFYNCQPAQVASLNILDVYGYIVNLTYTMKNGTKGFQLYYIDMTVSGCPQFQKILDPDFNSNTFDTALLHTPKPLGFSFNLYNHVYQDTNLSCNLFPSVKVKSGDCSGYANQYSCPVGPPYMYKTPIASVDFAHIKNVELKQLVDPQNPSLAGETLVEDNGLYATCVPRPIYNETDNGEMLDAEYCTADRYDNFPFCNRLDPKNSLSRILESYGYNEYFKKGLNANTACTISTLYAQGFNGNKYYGKDYSNCNCNSFTTFCGFAFLLPEYGSQNLGITTVFTRGYCEVGFRQDIMRKFLAIC